MTNIENIIKDCERIDINLTNKTCCFSGHRYQKLEWGTNENDFRCVKLKNELKIILEDLITKGYTYFISGMGLGFDMICAEIVLELKNKFNDIKLVAAVPCKTQNLFWEEVDKLRYENILSKADITRCVFDKYNKYCMNERNYYMVKNSSILISYFNGSKGGTYNTIKLAQKKGIEIINLYNNFNE